MLLKGMVCIVIARIHGHGYNIGDKVKVDFITGDSIKCSLIKGKPLNALGCWFSKEELKPLISLVH